MRTAVLMVGTACAIGMASGFSCACYFWDFAIATPLLYIR